MHRVTLGALFGTLLIIVGLSGCGWFASAPSAHRRTVHSTHKNSAPPTVASNTTVNGTTNTAVNTTNSVTGGANTTSNTSGSSPSNATITTNSTTNTTTSNSTQSNSSPPAPNAGSYSQLKLAVVKVTPEGSATSSGHTEAVYNLTLSVKNPTSGIVTLYLNDFSAVPVGGPYQYSWNDYSLAGLSSSNSLFPWPVSPSTPQTNQRYVFPNKPVTGEVTVQVPEGHGTYALVWGAPNSGQITATFSP